MGKFGDKMYKFMYGRYGTDELYRFICVAVLVLLVMEWILSIFIGKYVIGAMILFIITLFILWLLIWSVVRCFSRKIEKRKKQNKAFLRMKRTFIRTLTFNVSKKTKHGPMDGGGYIYRDCTMCSKTLRLPYKAGKNAVVCPECSHRFYVKAR